MSYYLHYPLRPCPHQHHHRRNHHHHQHHSMACTSSPRQSIHQPHSHPPHPARSFFSIWHCWIQFWWQIVLNTKQALSPRVLFAPVLFIISLVAVAVAEEEEEKAKCARTRSRVARTTTTTTTCARSSARLSMFHLICALVMIIAIIILSCLPSQTDCSPPYHHNNRVAHANVSTSGGGGGGGEDGLGTSTATTTIEEREDEGEEVLSRSILFVKPTPLALASGRRLASDSSQICPIFPINNEDAKSSGGGSGTPSIDSHGNSSGTTALQSMCMCYNVEHRDVFVECVSSPIDLINTTLNYLQQSHYTVRSLNIYKLASYGSEALPNYLFRPFTSISELHIGSTNLTKIGSEFTFAGLEGSLQKLSFVNAGLTSLSKSLLSKLKHLNQLDIQANKINQLESYAFYGLPLVALNLQNNLLESLHEYAFGGLENTLDELNLNNNRLGSFPLAALRRLRKLQTLRLQSNRIALIPDDGFTRLTMLETLDLQWNSLTHLNSRSFITMPKLRTLYCSNNQLTIVSDSSIFAQLYHLETLDLSWNRLRVVNLDGLSSIQTLDLSFNHLHDLRLQGMLGLRELFASNNNILHLSSATFLNTTALEALYLQHNSIQSIGYNTLHRLASLHVLDLSYNSLKKLPTSLFKHSDRLVSLYLDYNYLSDAGLEPGIFQELVELQDLHLQRNLLKNIKKGVFYSLPNLRELDLQMNQIEVIESFESLANLQHINLQGNRLTIFNGNVLSSFPSGLRYLQLSNNLLRELPNDTFRTQTDMEVVWLSYNQLKHVPANIFNDLLNLEKLYLDHNHIASIEGNAFRSLANLVYLNLEHNQLHHLTNNIFAGLDNLQELIVNNCEIIGIEPNVLITLGSLQLLDLSNNPIYSITKHLFHGAHKLRTLSLANITADNVDAAAFANLSALLTLDLSSNNLNALKLNNLKLPKSLQQLNISHNILSNEKNVELSADLVRPVNESLRTLDLSHTHFQIQNSREFFKSLPNLVSLHLSWNELTRLEPSSFPGSMFCASLGHLSMSGNLFEVIPDHHLLSTYAPNLKEWQLAHNQIKHIQSNAFASLFRLERLDLSHNRISIIESEAFANLTRLVHLDLSRNVLRSLSLNVFSNLKSLETLLLAGNWLQFMPNNLLKHTTVPLFARSLRTLDVDNNPMVRVREDLSSEGTFSELSQLKMQNANLSEIASHDLVGFPKLVRLLLGNNQIQTIAASAFRSLSKLLELDMSRNKLDNLPGERLEGLKQLEILNLSHNSLTELPHFAADLGVSLRTLDLGFNRVSRIESFGYLSSSVVDISLRHNMIGWIANNAFQNMTSLTKIDLRQNFLTQISEVIFESIEIRLQKIMLAGNPFQCDCRLLSIYEWFEEHSRLVQLADTEEMLCDQPEKLKYHSIQSLEPIDFCPIPMLTQFEIIKLEPSLIRLGWEVQNETLVGGFTLEYYVTSERSLTSPAGLQLNSAARTVDIPGLVAEKWYTVCIEANGKYLGRAHLSNPLGAASSPTAIVSADYYGQKHLLQDFVTSNRKCSQIRTLSHGDARKLVAIPAASIIIAIAIFFVLLFAICILVLILMRFRRNRRVQRQRSETIVSFGGVSAAAAAGVGVGDDDVGAAGPATISANLKLSTVEVMEIEPVPIEEDYITYRHFSLPSTEHIYTAQ